MEDAASWQRKGFPMITRRNCLIGASAALICAPAVVRAGNLMVIRGVIMPVQRNYYGFVDRLQINHLYYTGELRGPGLMQVVEDGVLNHLPRAQIAYDIARWGLQELSPTARRDRAIFFNSVPPVFPRENSIRLRISPKRAT